MSGAIAGAMATGSSLALAHPIRPELAVLAVVVATALIWWCYHRAAGLRISMRSVLTGLRVLALLLVGLAILQPVMREPEGTQVSGTVAVGIDVSSSMSLTEGS